LPGGERRRANALLVHDADLLALVDHRFEEVRELVAAAERLGNADPASGERKHGQQDERNQHGPGALVGVRVGVRLAEEGEVPEPEHVEGGEQSGHQAYEPQDGPAAGERKAW
jgi:hypothetical protein